MTLDQFKEILEKMELEFADKAIKSTSDVYKVVNQAQLGIVSRILLLLNEVEV